MAYFSPCTLPRLVLKYFLSGVTKNICCTLNKWTRISFVCSKTRLPDQWNIEVWWGPDYLLFLADTLYYLRWSFIRSKSNWGEPHAAQHQYFCLVLDCFRQRFSQKVTLVMSKNQIPLHISLSVTWVGLYNPSLIIYTMWCPFLSLLVTPPIGI